MKERPILFSGPMVNAILAGSKTQTRRVVTPQPAAELGETPGPAWNAGFVDITCPYGKPGDRLWVREAWTGADTYAFGGHPATDPPQCVAYRADKTAVVFGGDLKPSPANTYGWRWESMKWRPSIFMPRWASRLTVEVTNVRVQRLQEISEEDARAEGIQLRVADQALCATDFLSGDDYGFQDWTDEMPGYADTNRLAIESYRTLWDSINGKRPGCAWSDNPWVWAVSFKRVQP